SRDPRVGSFGALAGMVAVLVRFALSSGKGENIPWQAILLAPVAGRCVQVWAVAWFPYARAEGAGKVFRGSTGHREALCAAVVAAFLCAGSAGLPGLVWLAAGSLAGLAVAMRIYRRLGGLTGDSYGAVTEVAEWAALAVGVLLPTGALPFGPLFYR
ncbi:MAG: adenosylcobinamide-GDP ribazoletransferase, partial [Armatimonadota bacterium]|nr:adenosylcobinamide-GDP ribazoletransferase [Armatimonadota bacterium]